jgi:protein TonB
LDKEAVRVVQSLPKWKPGKQRGKAVKVSHSVPIKFALQN